VADSRSPHPCVLPAFRPSAKLVPPTTPSADFCAAVRPPYDGLSLVTETQRRSPEVRSTAFTARPPDLPPRPLMTVDFAITCSLVRPGRPRYPVLVHQAAVLLHAFFRRFLAVTPLRFANPSSSSGWIEDFHLQAVLHTRHTRKRPAPMVRACCFCLVIASQRVGAKRRPMTGSAKQSIAQHNGWMDCFVAALLAMTPRESLTPPACSRPA
jgi:hypothetical protein